MNPADTASHLSQIQTKWTVVFQAHQEGDHAGRAQNELAQRYLGAIYRYILGAVRDPHKADDLAQEFAIRLVRGAFRRATPERGRFRDFVKTAVRNLITDDKRRVKPHQMNDNVPEPVAVEESPPGDDTFIERWREELINRAWEGLAVVEKQSGQPYHTVLRQKADNPELRSAQIAERLTQSSGKPINEVAVRKLVQRSREKFAELLLDEVGRSIQSTTRSEIEDELVALGLLEYCKPALERSERKG
jgi:RNA polymerase sigma-70 factor (ECF subfamily)